MFLFDFDNIIFDLDGTIIDSSDNVLSCLKQAVIHSNVKFDETKLNRSLSGPPLENMVKILCPNISLENQQKVIQEYRKAYDNSPEKNTVLFDGMKQLLIDLKAENKKIFIATNKPSNPTEKICDYFALNFDDIYTIDKHPNKHLKKFEMINELIEKYSLDKSKTIMVGDAISDIDAAHRTGIKACAVLWGYEADKNILQEKADYVLEGLNS